MTRILVFLMFLMLGGASLSAETWSFTADEVTSVQTQGERRTVLRGDSRVVSETREISADELEMSGEDYNVIQGQGSVVLTDLEQDITVTAGRFILDRDTDIIRFREQVTLEDRAEGLVIRCEALDLLEDGDVVRMQVAVRLIKDNTIARGEFATYRRLDDTLVISGRPVVWRDDDEYRAERIRVNLDTDEIIMEGAVQGALTTRDEEQTGPTTSPSPENEDS